MINILTAAVILFLGCANQSPDNNPNEELTSLKPIIEYSIPVAEPSGLYFRNDNRTLYMAADDSPYIYIMDTTGNIIDRISNSLSDMEGITLSSDLKSVYVVKEDEYLVFEYDHSGRMIKFFKLVTSENSSNGLEGITIDDEGYIWLINEKNPCLLVKVSQDGKEISRKEINYSSDISDIFYDNITGTFWLVSDESEKLIQISKTGELIKQWKIPVKSAEGITMSDSHIFICSDTQAKLYIFNRPL